MSPASRDPFLYLVIVVQVICGKGICAGAYDVARKVAMFLKMSVSLFVVSSNPGVSMSTTRLPSSVNSFASWTSGVHDSKAAPTCKFDLLARFIN
jgi:hypothetical protein